LHAGQTPIFILVRRAAHTRDFLGPRKMKQRPFMISKSVSFQGLSVHFIHQKNKT